MLRLLPLAAFLLTGPAVGQVGPDVPPEIEARMLAFYEAHPDCMAELMALQTPSEAANPALRDELLALVEADQAERFEAIEAAGSLEGVPDSVRDALARRDSARTDRLREIVAEHGWPRAALVGTDGVAAAFLVLQHSPDRVLMAVLLPEIERAYEAGEIAGQSVALLTDRVRLAAGLPQRYGTQMDVVDGEAVLRPTEPGDLDARRAAMCMVPLDVYTDLQRVMYGVD